MAFLVYNSNAKLRQNRFEIIVYLLSIFESKCVRNVVKCNDVIL